LVIVKVIDLAVLMVHGVHFHVSNKKSSDRGFRNKDVPTFDSISLNLGGSFDASNGVFTATKSGVYQQFIFKWSLRVISGKERYGFLIEIFRNDDVIRNASIAPEDQVTMIEVTWKLSFGRVVIGTTIDTSV